MEFEIVKTQEEQNKIYIQMPNTNIDTFIYNNDYYSKNSMM